MANRFPLIFNSGAGQIQELAASDNLDLTSSNLVNAGILFTSSGSQTAPSISIGNGTTYPPGLYSPGTDQLAVATNGTRRLLIDSAGALTLDTGDATIYGVRVGRGGGAVSSNTAVGYIALASTTSGGDNTSVGYSSLTTNTNGGSNCAFGVYALRFNLGGSNNCAFGVQSLSSNVSGIKNTAYGVNSLFATVSGSENTVIGSYAGYNNTGANNICIGSDSGYALTTGSNNTIIGSIQGTAALANTVIIAAGGTERLRITSTNTLNFVGAGTAGSTQTVSLSGSAPINSLVLDSSGRLGIGVSSPGGRLVVADPGTAVPTTGYGTGFMVARADGLIGLAIGDIGSGDVSYLQAKNFTNADTKPIALNPSGGNVGIGTTGPTKSLEVAAGGTVGGGLLVTGSSSPQILLTAGGSVSLSMQVDGAAGYFGTSTNHTLVFRTNDTEKARIRTDGMFEVKGAGVSGSSPAFSVNGSAPANSFVIDSSGRLGIGNSDVKGTLGLQHGNTSPQGLTDVAIDALRITQAVGGIVAIRATQYDAVNQPAAGDTQFFNLYYNGSTYNYYERMRIRADGRVGIGSASPSAPLNIASTGNGHRVLIDDTTNDNTLGVYSNATDIRHVALNNARGAYKAYAIQSNGITFNATNGSASATIDSSGKLLVGTTTANTKFVFGGTTLTDAEVSVYTTNTNGGNSTSFSFWRNYSTGSLIPYRACYITNCNYDDSESATNRQSLGFFTKSGTAAPAERMTIGSTGDVSIVTGNLIIGTAGKGIDFSADGQAAGMTSELLDDYEEGTWTPVIRGSSTAGTYELITQTGFYTKIGRQVTLTMFLKLDTAITGGGTGYAQITGLPFGHKDDSQPALACATSGIDYSTNYTSIFFCPISGNSTTTWFLSETGDNVINNDLPISAISANDLIKCNGSYITI